MIRELVNRIIFDVVNQRDLDRSNRAMDESVDNARDAARQSNRVRVAVGRLSARLRAGLPALRSYAAGIGRIGASALRLGTRLGLVGGLAFAGFIGNAVRLASESEETRDRMSVALGDIADETEAWATRTSNALGINRNQVRSFVTDFSLQLQRATDLASATDLGRALTERAFDLESFQDVPIDEVFAAFRSGINGSTEPLDRFNVNLRASAVDAFILANGMAASSSAITENTRRLARARLILQETTNAQGNLILTSNSFANVFRRFQSTLTNIFTDIGDRFLPAARDLFLFLIDTVRNNQDNIVNFFTGIADGVQRFISDGGLQRIGALFQDVARFAGEAFQAVDRLFGITSRQREINAEFRQIAEARIAGNGPFGALTGAASNIINTRTDRELAERIVDARRFQNNTNGNTTVNQNVTVSVTGAENPRTTARAATSAIRQASQGLGDVTVLSPANN